MSQFYVGVTASTLPPTVIETITGNDGVPEGAVAHNFNILTANATPQFKGTAGTETLDFGLSNLLIGSSGLNITSAEFNVGLGDISLSALTSGIGNTCVGDDAGANITSSIDNTLIGFGSGETIVLSQQNTAVGSASLTKLVNGTGNNTAIGTNSLTALTSGANNTCIGYNSGSSYSSSENGNIVIGLNTGTLGDINIIRIGVQGTQVKSFIAGISGITAAGSPVAISSTGQLSDLGFGTAGQILTSNGAAVSPTWISQSPDAITWTNTTGTTQAMAINSGYLANNAGLVTLTLPATAAQFAVIKVVGVGAGGWKIAQNANQKITWLGTSSTVGVTGFMSSVDTNACVTLRCVVGGSSTFWVAEQTEGNITLS
jgi:hypothetical protein